MQKLERDDLIKLLNKKTKEADLCHYYYKFDEEVQDMLEYLYEALWRFNMYDSQIIYVMNESLRAFRIRK